MTAPEKYELTLRLYKDIVNGYSVFLDHNGESVYLKHLKDVDYAYFEQKKEYFSKQGEELGLPSEEEYVKLLIDSNNWSQEEENRYQILLTEINNLSRTEGKIFLESQRKIIAQRVQKKRKELQKLSSARDSISIKTTKAFAIEKLNDFIMTTCFYKDEDLKTPLYSYEQYQELDVDDLAIYSSLYGQATHDFNEKNLQRVGHCGLFLNSFMLAQGNPYYFFGKRIADLSSYQTIIASHGNGCKNILENSDNTMPNYEDIDEICEWFEREVNLIKQKYKPKGPKQGRASNEPSASGKKTERFEGLGVVGASKEEFQQIAEQEKAQPVDFVAAAEKLKKKLGKDTLTAQDILKIHD